MLLRTVISTLLLAVSLISIAQVPLEDIRQQLLPSVLNKQDMLQELAWFRQTSQPFKGKSIRVVSENIPTHHWEKNVLAKQFEALTGIHIDFHIIGEGAVVEAIFKQISQGVHLYDSYINDADHVGTHTRLKGVVNLTEYMQGEGKAFTNPNLNLKDFINLEFGQDYQGQQLQLPDQQFANLYWFRHDWFSRKDIRKKFRAFTQKKYGKKKAYDLDVPVNWAAYEDIAEFFTITPIDGHKVYGHMDFGKKSPSLGWRFTDAWLSIAGAGDVGLPNGSPVGEWGIRAVNGVPKGSAMSRGGATNSPAAVYALQTYIDWLNKYSPPSASTGTFTDNNIGAAKGNVAQQIFFYTLWLNEKEYHQAPMLDRHNKPVWRLAPTPHGRYWEHGMKAGYQDAGSWTIPKDTRGPKRAAAWLWAQFCVSQSASLVKFIAGGTPVRHSTLQSQYVQENKDYWGGLVEFYQSNGVKHWTDTGLNVPNYPLLFRVWWPNLDKAIQGDINAQQAMDNIAHGQDSVMLNMRSNQYQPTLNKKKTAQYWLQQPGAPKPSKERQTPKTMPYSQIIKQWHKAP